MRHQLADERDRLGILEVEREALLPGVELRKIGASALADGRPRPHVLAFRRLDLDELGAEIRHEPRTIRTRNHCGEVEHAYAVENTGQMRRAHIRLVSFGRSDGARDARPAPPIASR